MKLKLISKSDENIFQDWFCEHDGDLLIMECEDIARQSFMAGMKAAQQTLNENFSPRCPKCNAVAGWHHEACEDYVPDGFCQCGTSIENHAGMGCLYRSAREEK